jgi:hypothetical protein
MDSSFASYLLPWAIQAKMPVSFRVKIADRFLDFRPGRYGMEAISHTGSILQKRIEYDSKEWKYKTVSPCPFTDPIADVVKHYYALDSNTLRLEDFQVFQLIQKTEGPSYAPKVIYEIGAQCPMSWKNAWAIEGQTADILRTVCEDDKKNLPAVFGELLAGVPYSQISNLRMARAYKINKAIQLCAPGKTMTQKCVFLKNGAIYDYNDEKVVAESLESWLKEYLGIGTEVTWETIYDHVLLGGAGLPTMFAGIPLKKEKLELRKMKEQWKQIDSKIRDAMPFLNGGNNRHRYRNGTIQLVAFMKSTGTMETYSLDNYGPKRNFEQVPLPNGQLTSEQLQVRQERCRPLTLEAFKLLASNPDSLWFAQVHTKWFHSQMERIDLRKCL